MVFVVAKTRRSRRTVHLARATIAALGMHEVRQRLERRRAGDMWHDQDLVFCGPSGGPLDPAHINHTFHRTLSRIGPPRIRVHDLRHAVATYLASEGYHPSVVQALLGHSTGTLTLNTYSLVLPSLLGTVAGQKDRLFEGDDGLAAADVG